MNVLQVTPYSVHPPSNGGDHRMHGLMLGQGENDTVRRFAKSSYSNEQADRTIEIDDRYREFRYTSLLESIPMHLTGKIVDVPSIYTSWIMSVTRPKILHEHIDVSDIVVVEHPWQFKYIDEISGPNTPVVYSSHNFEPELYSEFRDSWRTKPFYELIMKLERFAVSGSALTVVTSQRDKTHYKKVFDASGPFHVAPNAAYQPTSDDLDPQNPGKENFSTCFVGSDHRPNLEAVELIKSYAKQLPAVEFFVIGSVCRRYESRLMPDNVHLEGFVDSLNGYYRRCDIALNPIQTGSGSNVKMPEYFANGLPVITTPFGARGVQGEPNIHYVEREPHDFPETIKSFRDGSRDMETIGENARELVKTTLNWKAVSKGLFDELRKLKS